MTHGHGFVIKRVEVDRHAEWSSDFILTTVTPTDGARVIEIHVPMLAKLIGELSGER